MHKRDGESERGVGVGLGGVGGRSRELALRAERRRVEEADARVSSSESSEEDGEEDGKAMRKRYDEARGAIERALRGEETRRTWRRSVGVSGALLLNAGDMLIEHAKS